VNTQDFMNAIYDILAQNTDMVTQEDRDDITDVIDHVDTELNALVFRLDNGREFMLRLVDTYAPSSESKGVQGE